MKRLWNALNGNGGRELLIDTLSYGLAKAVPGILGLLSVVVFLRVTNESAYGRFALVTAIINVWITFSSGWFYQGLLRFGAQLTGPPEAFHRIMRAGLTLSGLAFLLSCLPHLWWETGLSTATGAGLAFGGVALVQTTLLAKLQASLRARSVLIVELLRSSACFLFAVGLAWCMTDGPTALLLGTALGYALSVTYLWTRCTLPSPARSGLVAGPAETALVLRRIWGFGWPLSLWLAAQLMLPLIDRTMMATQLGLGETGKYAGLSDILTRCFSLAVFPVIQAVYPRLAQLTDRQAHAEARSLLRRATLLLLLTGGALQPVLFLLRHQIVRFALPVPDESFEVLVLPLSAGGFVWQAAMLLHKPLELAQKTHLMLGAIVAAVLLKAVGNCVLLPGLGVLGAALATLLSGLSYCALCLWLGRRLSQ